MGSHAVRPRAPFRTRTLVALSVCALLAGTAATALALCSGNPHDNAAVEMVLNTSPGPDVRIVSDVSSNPRTDPVAAKQAKAVRAAVEPLIEGYEGAVSVTYQPVGLPAGLYGSDGETERLSASMIKMLVLSCLLDQAESGDIDMQAKLIVEREDIVGGSGVIQEEGSGGIYTLDELAFLMIAASDNTATNMLIDRLGIDAINAEARKLGLPRTRIYNKMMARTNPGDPLNCTCSDDLARIFDLVATGGLVDEQASTTALRYLGRQAIDEGLVAGLPEGVSVAHKTGELDGVVNDGGIVYASTPYVLVVMVEGVDNYIAGDLIKRISGAVYEASEKAVG